MPLLTVKLTEDQMARLKERSDRSGVPVSELVRRALFETPNSSIAKEAGPGVFEAAAAALDQGLADVKAGRTRPWSEVKKSKLGGVRPLTDASKPSFDQLPGRRIGGAVPKK